MAVPTVSIADVHVLTTFVDDTYNTANVSVGITLANDAATGQDDASSAATGTAVGVDLTMEWPGNARPSLQQRLQMQVPAAGAIGVSYVNFAVPGAGDFAWSPEFPNLFNLTVQLNPAEAVPTSEMVQVGGVRWCTLGCSPAMCGATTAMGAVPAQAAPAVTTVRCV